MRNQHTDLLCGLPPSDCRSWPFITESKQRVHTAETEMAEALSKGYNSVTVTPADHGDQFPVPIPHSALQIVLTDGKDYRSFWYTRYFPNSFCGICLTHQNAVTKAVIHPGYNLGYNSGEHRAPRCGSPPSLFRQRYCPCMGRTIQVAATRGLARRVGGMIDRTLAGCPGRPRQAGRRLMCLVD
jgi:hypothetical protein